MLNKYELLLKALEKENLDLEFYDNTLNCNIRRVKSYLSGRLVSREERDKDIRHFYGLITVAINTGKFTPTEARSIRNYTLDGRINLLLDLLLDTRNLKFINFCSSTLRLLPDHLFLFMLEGLTKSELVLLPNKIKLALATAFQMGLLSLDEYDAIHTDTLDDRLAMRVEEATKTLTSVNVLAKINIS